ncbi:outer membrane beta-barrel protein [Pedobacter sp.]|uniref:outer membrane beta-barrel protein n=1 Tax=Pedobacter sp. TaxID=1411316 RepID=UPI003D7F82DF
MNLKALFSLSAIALTTVAYAQETESTPFEFSGSADAYYKYDFQKHPNIGTSFASDHNSISLGMLDFAVKKTTGKASFLGEVSFGPRGQYQSLLNGDNADGNSENTFHLQNLSINYAFTDNFTMTAGFMGTFVGYEVISPVGNFNYSTSYLFSAGPFQNAGIKGTYTFSPKVSLMVGLFDDWNVYKDVNGVSHFGAQLGLSPVEGWSAYLNVLTGRNAGAPGDGSLFDITTSFQVTEKVKIGLNAADYSISNDNGGYSGAALYLQNSFTPGFALGLRGEYFKTKDVGTVNGEVFNSITLSGNFKTGGLTFIPEVRFDKRDDDLFTKSNLSPTNQASQFSLAAVYAF